MTTLMYVKKLSSVFLSIATLSLLAGGVFVAPAQAQVSIDQMQSQITALLAQIQALQSQLGAGAFPAPAVFARDLTIGSRGSDVRALQQFLNSKGFSVAPSGPGSLGNETEYFGPMTRDALARYQAANGISPSLGYFGPKSRAFIVAAIVPPVVVPPVTPPPVVTPPPATPPFTGVEGAITARLAAVPSNNAEIRLGTTESAMGIEIKATNSDVSVRRIHLNFSNPDRIRPWQLISAIAVYDGDILLKSASSVRGDFEEISFGTDYRLTLDGVAFVVPEGSTRVLTIKVTALSAVDGVLVTLPQTLNLTLKRDAIRGVDGAGLNQFAPSIDLTRSARIVSTLTGRTELSSPVVSRDRVAIGSNTGITSDVPLLNFTLSAREADLAVRVLSVNATSSSLSLESVVSALKLYDGSTPLASVTPAALSTFTDLSIFIPRGGSKTLTVRGDLSRVVGEGEWVQVSFTANASNVIAEDANERSAVITSGSATGSKYFIYTRALAAVLNSASLAASTATGQQAQADGMIAVAITAMGGDIFIRESTGITAASNAQITSVSVTSQSNLTATASGNWKIASGSTEIFRVGIHLDNTGGTAGFKRAWLSLLAWNTSDGAVYTTWTNQLGFGTALIVGDFKTGDVFLSN